MIQRSLQNALRQSIERNPAVALLGPRQAGKTTLALAVSAGWPSVYLDLENPTDRAKLSDARGYLAGHADKLVILDEVHRSPEIFQALRGLIDEGRRRGRTGAQFLLLGSASVDLLRQSGESLAGRISYLELSPFDAREVPATELDRLWIRGGFPPAFLARDDAGSMEWRGDFIRTYLERDVPQFGSRVPAETMRRLWTMLAHHQAALLNAAALGAGLGVDGKTVARNLDLLVDLLLVRRLPAWHANEGKRLVKSPKVFIRDSGLVHALLRIGDREQLLGHPVVGGSWEGFVIESLLAAAPRGSGANFYRTATGNEIDLLLTLPGGRLWAIEVKRSTSPSVERGFHLACADLRPDRRFVVYPGTERFTLPSETEAIGLTELAQELHVSSPKGEV